VSLGIYFVERLGVMRGEGKMVDSFSVQNHPVVLFELAKFLSLQPLALYQLSPALQALYWHFLQSFGNLHTYSFFHTKH